MIGKVSCFSSCPPNQMTVLLDHLLYMIFFITIINHPPTKNSKNETSESVTKHQKKNTPTNLTTLIIFSKNDVPENLFHQISTLGVSKNEGTPKSPLFHRVFQYFHHPRGTPIFGLYHIKSPFSHHHLGEYVWNIFSSTEQANPSTPNWISQYV